MDISVEQEENEIWVNQAFCVPSLPESRRGHYPFSRCPARIYRLKLSVILLHAACALFRADDPCHRLALLLNCWLIFVTCEGVYKNYPWREPLNMWVWRLYWAIPCYGVVLSICTALLLLTLVYLGSGCELSHPVAAAIVVWLCCMLCWPSVRESWHREERSEDDYDQFSATRSYALTLPRQFRIMFAALRSPSLLALLAAFDATSVVSLFLPGWMEDAWTVATAGLLLAGLALLCCLQLPDDVCRNLATWEVEEAAYARRIENCLRVVKGNLRTSGPPREGSTRFDRLAVQVPLLLREAKILCNASRTITESRTQELDKLTNSRELVEFRGILDDYGPYTTECCVS